MLAELFNAPGLCTCVHTIFSQQALACLAGRIQLVLRLETPCSRAVTNSQPWEVTMHPASKIKSSRGFSVSPEEEGRAQHSKSPSKTLQLTYPSDFTLLLKLSPLWTALKHYLGRRELTLHHLSPKCEQEGNMKLHYNAVPGLAKELSLIWWKSICPHALLPRRNKPEMSLVHTLHKHPHNLNTPSVIPVPLPSTSEAAPGQQMDWIFPARVDWAGTVAYPCKNALLWGFSCSSLALCGQDMH